MEELMVLLSQKVLHEKSLKSGMIMVRSAEADLRSPTGRTFINAMAERQEILINQVSVTAARSVS